MFELFWVAVALAVLVGISRRSKNLERRLAELEQRVAAFELRTPPLSSPSPPVATPPLPAAPTPKAPVIEAERPSEQPPGSGPSQAAPPAIPRAEPQPARKQGLEEAIGSRWAVWVGGLALGLGGLFLVRYSIEEGLLGPGIRVTLGLIFALALLVVGEWLRRREEPLGIAAFGKANIPAMLTAAGTSTAFATVYAAYALYALIGPAFAFVALGAIAFVTMGAAILHGAALGAIGLVAALVSPMLIESRDPSPIALVLYLAFAVGAAYGVARIRLWRWLAISAAIGALFWGFGLLVMSDPSLLNETSWRPGLIAHVLLQIVLALLFLVVDPYRNVPSEETRIDRMATIVLFAFVVLAIVTGETVGAGLARPLFAGVVTVLLGVAAILYPPGAAILAAAGFMVTGTLALWPVLREVAREPERIIPDLPSAPYPESVSAFIATAVLLAAFVALAGLFRLATGRRLGFGAAAWYAAATTLTPLAALIVAYWRLASFDHSIPFALVAGALALGFSAATAWLRRTDPELDAPVIRLAVGALASAAVASLAAGLTFALDRGVLTIALALSVLGTAVIADRLRLPALRWMVGALGIAVAARFAWDPSIMRGEIGRTPIFNWLLWGYGVPGAAFLLASRVLSRQGRDWVVRFVESLGYVFVALLIFLEIRHALHAGDPFALRSDHLEAGLVVTEALAFTWLMVRLDLFRPDSLYRVASILLGVVSIVGAALALGIRFNPYLSGEAVIGGALFNSLLPAYLMPAALAAAVAWSARANRPRPFVFAAAGLAVLLLLAYFGLEIRRLFHPDGRIGLFRSTSQAELWCYSLVLLGNGLALLALGVIKQWKVVRLAALACLVAAVLKVFLIDLSALEGLTRALSFVGLGIALLLMGFVYQRLIARPDAAIGEG